MMTATDTRKMARESLTGKWGIAVLITFCYVLIEFALDFLYNFTSDIPFFNFIISIITLVTSIPLSFGLLISFMKLKRGEEVGAFDFLTLGFSHFSRAWKVCFRQFLKLALPIILMIISYIMLLVSSTYILATTYTADFINTSSLTTLSSDTSLMLGLAILGVILIFISSIMLYVKQLSYSLSFFIAYDEPNITAKEAVMKSKNLMQGKRGSYFVLLLSFIGWAILATLTLGIGYLWLLPYMQVATVCFYDTIVNNTKSNEKVEQQNTTIEV